MQAHGVAEYFYLFCARERSDRLARIDVLPGTMLKQGTVIFTLAKHW